MNYKSDTNENIETVKKIVDMLNAKENLTDNEFSLLYLYTKCLLNVITGD